MSRQIIWSCSPRGRWSQRSDDLPAHSSFSRLFHFFRIAGLKCFFMRRGLSDSKMSSIEPMSYMSRVSCAFIAQLFRTLRAHWRLSRISRLLFLLMAILHKSVRIAICSRAGRGSWFATRYAAALAHLVGWPCSSLMMDMWKVARVSMDRLSRTMLSSPYMKTGRRNCDRLVMISPSLFRCCHEALPQTGHMQTDGPSLLALPQCA